MELTDALHTNGSLYGSAGSGSMKPMESHRVERLPPADSYPEHSEQKDATHTTKTVEQAHHFGRNVRLAMACMDGAERLQKIKVEKEAFEKRRAHIISAETCAPLGTHSFPVTSRGPNDFLCKVSNRHLSSELHKISAQIDTHRAELIELLVQFDEQQGWAESGARHCADWANANLGIAKSSAYNFLRVGRKLHDLPLIRALFRGGELSWSKVKLLVDVADADNEKDLAHVSLSATVNDVERICREFRWPKREAQEQGDPATGRNAADLRSEQQFNHRSFTWYEQTDGSIMIKISLPPEKAQAVLRSLEHSVNELYEGSSGAASHQLHDTQEKIGSTDEDDPVPADRPTINQRRADAMVIMAERSLQYAGTDIRRSDTNQVIIHVDTKDFISEDKSGPNSTANIYAPRPNKFPTKLPWIEGAGALSDTVARRVSCDAAVVSILMSEGEPLNIGRKTRTWPTAIWRAIVTRDRHCQFPGCSEHRHLEVHHIKHWADGGETSVENGLCLCHRHHSLVHEGGYTVEHNSVTTNPQRGSKEFGTTMGFVSQSKKALLPTRHRFRFVKLTVPKTDQNDSGCGCNESHPVYNMPMMSIQSNLLILAEPIKPEPVNL